MTETMANPELVRTLAFYGGLLSAKTGLMSLLTVRHRIKKKVRGHGRN